MEVVNNESSSRYEMFIDGSLASFAEYHIDGDTITFPHTVTDPKFRGTGLAAIVVQRALDDARAARRTVIAQCWYVREFIAQHPEYADLASRPSGTGR